MLERPMNTPGPRICRAPELLDRSGGVPQTGLVPRVQLILRSLSLPPDPRQENPKHRCRSTDGSLRRRRKRTEDREGSDADVGAASPGHHCSFRAGGAPCACNGHHSVRRHYERQAQARRGSLGTELSLKGVLCREGRPCRGPRHGREYKPELRAIGGLRLCTHLRVHLFHFSWTITEKEHAHITC